MKINSKVVASIVLVTSFFSSWKCAESQSQVSVKQEQASTSRNQKAEKSQTAATGDSESGELILKSIHGLSGKGNYDQAIKLMTPRGRKEFVSSKVYEVVSLINSGTGNKKELRSSVELLKTYGVDPQSPMFTEIATTNQKFEQIAARIVEPLGDDTGVQAFLKSLARLKPETDAVNTHPPFDLEYVKSDINEATILSQFRPKLPADVRAEMVRDGILEVALADLPIVFHRFRKVNGQWLWDGTDMESQLKREAARLNGNQARLLENPEFSGATVTGVQVKLEDYRDKVVLLDFWGTWCAPCVAQLPELQAIHELLQPHGFEIVGIAQNQTEDLKAFLSKTELPWTNVVDDKGLISTRFRVGSFPTTMLIDRGGKHVGSNLHGTSLVDELVQRLEIPAEKIKKLKELIGHDEGRASQLSPPADPGKDFVFLESLNSPVDDAKVFGALFHRSLEKHQTEPAPMSMANVPASVNSKRPSIQTGEPDLRQLAEATLVFAMRNGDFFGSAGGVLISEDGLALTNYHVAQTLQNGSLLAFTADGKHHQVVQCLAASKDRDIALLSLAGGGFTAAPLAKKQPGAGERLIALHHSEHRFYTYDAEMVMRHAIVGEHPWMEVSVNYAPGGSGCGIFNQRHELVGLAAIVKTGDGPSLALTTDFTRPNGLQFNADLTPAPFLLVRHAVPLDAIFELWQQ